MIRGITFDKQLMKSQDHAHEVNYYYQGDIGITKGCTVAKNVDENLVVSSGYFLVKGRLVAVDGSEIVTVPSVASGTLYSILVFEIDLTQANTLTEFNQGSFKIVSDSVSYPTLTQQDLDNGGTLYQFEFVRFENTVGGIIDLSDTRIVLNMNKYASSVSYASLLLNSSWIGSSAPFSQEVTFTGLLSTDEPIIDVSMSGTYSTDLLIEENWSLIYDFETSANTITFYAHAIPTIDLPFHVKVVR